MSDTYKHKWQYLHKKYWENWKPLKDKEIILWEPEKNWKNGEIMNSLLGNYVEVEYTLERPKNRGFNPPNGWDRHKYCYYCHRGSWIKGKVWWRQYLNKKHRRQWRMALRNDDYDNKELDRRPRRYAWFVD